MGDVLALATASDLFLGGGDATRWPHLPTLLAENMRRDLPQRIWVEAPAASFTESVLDSLARLKAHGIRVQIEAAGAKMAKQLGVGDGEAVIAEAERRGLATEVRLSVRPKTFPIVVPLARRLYPRRIWLEIIRQNWSGPALPMPADVIDQAMAASPNVEFSSHRLKESGYLPPCLLPTTWATRATAWRVTLNERQTPNAVFDACRACALTFSCQWNDPGAVDVESGSPPCPIVKPREQHRATTTAVPATIAARRPSIEVVCIAPWTTMEIADPDGKVHQCCTEWTVGHRGLLQGSTLLDVWNGPGYRQARRIMASGEVGALCMPICSRLHDRAYDENRLTIQSGTDVFVRNQLLLADEIAARKEVLTALPLRLALCPSTYCNYDCIMCSCGRTPRRDLDESIWDELPRFLPTLQSLTLLGGEPLANPHTWRFLQSFDIERYPDAALDLITNGSLLTENALKQIRKCALGDITISVNAGTAEVYEHVQRGITFEQLGTEPRRADPFPRVASVVVRDHARIRGPAGSGPHAHSLRRARARQEPPHSLAGAQCGTRAVARLLPRCRSGRSRARTCRQVHCVDGEGASGVATGRQGGPDGGQAGSPPSFCADLRTAIPRHRGRRARMIRERRHSIALLDLHARPDGFQSDASFGALGAMLEAQGHSVSLVRSVLGSDPDGPAAWHARLVAFVESGGFDFVVLARAWDGETLAVIRRAMPAGAHLVRLTEGVRAALDEQFDHVVDVEGFQRLLDGDRHPAPAEFRPVRPADMRRRAESPIPPRVLAPSPLPGGAQDELSARPVISGPASGCPFLLDAGRNPLFTSLGLDPTRVQTKGCTFCLDNTGSFAVFPEAAVLESWLGQLRRLGASSPGLREVLLTDERPHPYFPGLFRALIDDPSLPRIELLFKSRVDWLLEFAESAIADAAQLAMEHGSVLHLYLVGFESFDQFHLNLFNKGVRVADNVAAIEKIRELGRRFPRSFEFRRYRAHGIVLFTPWTTPESLLENARWMRAVGFDEFRSDALRTRLRLYPRVPLHALAEKDGLLVSAFDAGRPDRAVEQGYDASIPWRFRDDRVEAIFRAANDMRPTGLLSDADRLEAAVRQVTGHRGLASVPDVAWVPIRETLLFSNSADLMRAGINASLLGIDREIELIVDGQKRACLKEDVPRREAERLCRAYRAMDLVADIVELNGISDGDDVHEQGSDYAMVAVAANRGVLDDVISAQRAHRSEHDPERRMAAVRAMGSLMGYPACCVDVFVRQQMRGDNLDNERLTFRRALDAPLHPLIHRIGAVRLISHYPCSPSCAASIRIGEQVLALLSGDDPLAARRIRDLMKRPVLLLDYRRRLELQGAWEDRVFRVDCAVIPADSRHSWVDAAAVRSIELAPTSVRLTMREGQVVDLRADYPLLTNPGGLLAPAAIDAIGGSLQQAPIASVSDRPPSLPRGFQVGARVDGYEIHVIEARREAHEIVLARAEHSFTIRVRTHQPGRTYTIRRAGWAIDIDAAESLPAEARAAVGALVRALPPL